MNITLSIIVFIYVCILIVLIYSSIHSDNKKKNIPKFKKYMYTIDNISPQYKHIQRVVSGVSFYYINLNKSTDRNNYITSQSQHLRLTNIYRIEGVYGHNIINNTYTFSNGRKLFIKSDHHYHSKSELGCVLSHIVAIYTAYIKGDENAVILEDDVCLNVIKLWKSSIQDTIDEAPSNWKIIQLYEYENLIAKKYVSRNEQETLGTMAYLINRDGMKTILDHVDFKEDMEQNIHCHIKLINKHFHTNYAADYYLYNMMRDNVYTGHSKFITNNLLLKSNINSGSFIERYFTHTRDETCIRQNNKILYERYLKDYNALNNNIDAILIINLEKDKKRFSDITSNLLKYNFDQSKIIRIDAIYNKWNGHLGCGKSHVKALELAIEKDYNNVLILEDDFQFTADTYYMNNIITKFFTEVTEWDVLDIEKKDNYASINHTIYDSNIKRINSSTMTGAFIVNKKYYNTLLENRKESIDKLQIETDEYIKECKIKGVCEKIIATNNAIDQYHKKIQPLHNWFLLKPPLGNQLSLINYNTSNTMKGGLVKDDYISHTTFPIETYRTHHEFPQIIHQIWIGDKIPDVKKLYIDSFKQILDNTWEFKLWGNDDITRDNFPITYDYIQLIKEHKIKNNYSPYASMADLMKFEIMYHWGGFYFDTNIELLKDITPLIDNNYDIIVCNESNEITEYLSCGFIGAKPKTKYFKNLLTKQNLDNIDYGSPKSNVETGPYFFFKAFTNIKDDKKVKILPTEYIYPIPPGDINSKLDKCINYENKTSIYPCKEYKNSYAIDHFFFGFSWAW